MNESRPPVAVQQTTVIQVGSQKSVAGAVLLALFFGPLGMLYATVPGALIMFLISFVVAIATLGLGLLITLPICAIWAGIAASSHNQRLGVSGHQAALVTPAAAPAGWHPDPDGGDRLRYFDGIRWTDQYAQQAAPEPSAQEEKPPAQIEAAVPEPEEVPEPDEVETRVQDAPALPGAEQVYCGSCGHSITPSARFCSGCGEAQAIA